VSYLVPTGLIKSEVALLLVSLRIAHWQQEAPLPTEVDS
jgi:hypothetical protein